MMLDEMVRPTGFVRYIPRKSGLVAYAQLRLPDGSQPTRRLGVIWEKRSRPPAGYITRAQAEARLAAILAGDDPLINVEPSHVTFAHAARAYLHHLEHERARKRSTLRDYRNVIEHDLIPHIGASTPIEEITALDIEELRGQLLARVSRRTTQKVLVIAHGILAHAVRRGWRAENPAAHIEKVQVRRSEEFHVLSVEQVHAVSREAEFPELIQVAAFTGLRQGELLALHWRAVDFGARLVRVDRNLVDGAEDTPKSHRRRSVPLSDQALVALDRLSRRERFTGPDDLVFCSVTGDHLSSDRVRDDFYRALEAAGLGELRRREHPIVFHDLRHTFGTLCAAAGIDLPRIQRWMGHADIQTTMRYLHYVPAHDDADRLTRAFGGSGVQRAYSEPASTERN